MKDKEKILGYTESILSTIANFSLFLVKYWVGVKINSVAVKADAWHTLSDIITSLVVFFGFWISSRKADKEHPFGHGRAEQIAAIVIGTLLAVVGFKFLEDSFIRLRTGQGVVFPGSAIIIIFITALVKEALAQFSIISGKKINSKALIADGWHHRSDAISSLIIVIGAFFSKYFWWIDAALGIAVAMLVFYAAFEVFKNTIDSLLGKEPDETFCKKLEKLVAKVAPQVTMHHLHIHNYGDHHELTFHVRISGELRLKEAHEIVSIIEDSIRKEMNMESTIHIEPFLTQIKHKGT